MLVCRSEASWGQLYSWRSRSFESLPSQRKHEIWEVRQAEHEICWSIWDARASRRGGLQVCSSAQFINSAQGVPCFSTEEVCGQLVILDLVWGVGAPSQLVLWGRGCAELRPLFEDPSGMAWRGLLGSVGTGWGNISPSCSLLLGNFHSFLLTCFSLRLLLLLLLHCALGGYFSLR